MIWGGLHTALHFGPAGWWWWWVAGEGSMYIHVCWHVSRMSGSGTRQSMASSGCSTAQHLHRHCCNSSAACQLMVRHSPAAPLLVAVAARASVHHPHLDHSTLVIAHAVAVKVLAELGGHGAVLAAHSEAAAAAARAGLSEGSQRHADSTNKFVGVAETQRPGRMMVWYASRVQAQSY